MVGNEKSEKTKSMQYSIRSVDKLSVAYYVTNFPPDVDGKDIWKVCEKVWVVSDVYVALKLSKIGKRFAFVRFIKVLDEKTLELQLRDTWMGQYHLFVSLARFHRDDVNQANDRPRDHNEHNMGSMHAARKGSYANVVKGGVIGPLYFGKDMSTCSLQVGEIYNKISLQASLF
ncbi:unnamed protein product [Lactuca virosa]|uniref:RRM domain-containing protein n=1 Tax=Lactuca virosa TaxID=75947 RepID=A0AAU9NKM9_9ASTR|nr:unnamed protein product [Lactuca virosa]